MIDYSSVVRRSGSKLGARRRRARNVVNVLLPDLCSFGEVLRGSRRSGQVDFGAASAVDITLVAGQGTGRATRPSMAGSAGYRTGCWLRLPGRRVVACCWCGACTFPGKLIRGGALDELPLRHSCSRSAGIRRAIAAAPSRGSFGGSSDAVSRVHSQHVTRSRLGP